MAHSQKKKGASYEQVKVKIYSYYVISVLCLIVRILPLPNGFELFLSCFEKYYNK